MVLNVLAVVNQLIPDLIEQAVLQTKPFTGERIFECLKRVMLNAITDQKTVRLRTDFYVEILQPNQQQVCVKKLVGRVTAEDQQTFFLQFERINHLTSRAVCSSP